VAWSDGGLDGTFSDPTALHPTYTHPIGSSGIQELRLTVTDALRLRVNSVPIVTLGDDTEASGRDVVIPDIIDVGDTDGWIASYVWDDGKAGGRFPPSPYVADPTYEVPEGDGCHAYSLDVRAGYR